MKLRFPFRPQQLLSVIGGALLLGVAAFFPGAAAQAQDTIILNTGVNQQGKVLGITPSGQLEFQLAGTTNKLGLALNQIKEVRMTPPPEYALAYGAYTAKDY